VSDRPIDGLLLDVDGVLAVSWEAIPGAVEALSRLRRDAVPFRLMTNTTTMSRVRMATALREAGFDVEPNDILNATMATAQYLRTHHPGAGCFLLGIDETADDLEGVELVEEDAEVVVIAGADEAFHFDNLNRAFRMIMAGAEMVAMHKNLYWMEADGLSLDAGAYVLGIEAASGRTAAVAGKPAPAFFESALEALGLPAERVAMVGDDIDADVLAAQRFGMTGILVRTGKYRPDAIAAADGEPDIVVDSIADVPDLVAGGRARSG